MHCVVKGLNIRITFDKRGLIFKTKKYALIGDRVHVVLCCACLFIKVNRRMVHIIIMIRQMNNVNVLIDANTNTKLIAKI